MRRTRACLAAIAFGVFVGASGCASTFMTLLDPKPFAGTVADAKLIQRGDPLVLFALGDIVPSVALDTAVLPYTTVCAVTHQSFYH